MSSTSKRLRWALGIALGLHLLFAAWMATGLRHRQLSAGPSALAREAQQLPKVVQVAPLDGLEAPPKPATPSPAEAAAAAAEAEAKQKALELAAAQAAAAEAAARIAPLQAISGDTTAQAAAVDETGLKTPATAIPEAPGKLDPLTGIASPAAVAPVKMPPPASASLALAKATPLPPPPKAKPAPAAPAPAKPEPPRVAAAPAPVAPKPVPVAKPQPKPPVAEVARAAPSRIAPAPVASPAPRRAAATAPAAPQPALIYRQPPAAPRAPQLVAAAPAEPVYQLPAGKLSLRLANPPPRPAVATPSGTGLAVEAGEEVAAAPALPSAPLEGPASRPLPRLPPALGGPIGGPIAPTLPPPTAIAPAAEVASAEPAAPGATLNPPVTIFAAPEPAASPDPVSVARAPLPGVVQLSANPRIAYFQGVTTLLKATNAQALADDVRGGEKIAVRMKFAVKRDGSLVRIGAAVPTPDWAVAAAAQVIRAAAPYPPAPAELPGKTIELSYPVEIYRP